MLNRQHIVVGVSRTPSGAAALRWALQAAVTQDWEVTAVHSFDVDLRADLAMDHDPDAEVRASARRAQVWVQQMAENDEARRLLQFRSCVGHIEDVLAKESVGATLLVMGAPTLDQHGDLPAKLRQRCHCPVILVDESGAAVTETATGRQAAALPDSLDA
jgi:nucleotide-binding universal stress UspA family protein